MRKAYSYIRMSTDTQLKGDSLRRQMELSKNYAIKNNLTLVESIDGRRLEDIGISAFHGKNATDGVLSIFLKHLESGNIEKNSVLLVESLDRLSRDRVTGAMGQFISIINNGVEIVTLIDKQIYNKKLLDENPYLIMMGLTVMMRANEESETKSNRGRAVWSKKRENAKKNIITKSLPGWLFYDEKEKKIKVIEGRGAIVEKIFDMYSRSIGMDKIARTLNEESIPVFGSGRMWYRSYIKKVLENIAVYGSYQPYTTSDGRRYKIGEVIDDYFPAVISKDIFDKANATVDLRKESGRGRKGKTVTNLFSGLIYCSMCDSKMHVVNKGKGSKGGRYVSCIKSKNKAGCEAEPIRLEKVEKAILNHLRELDFTEIFGGEDKRLKCLNVKKIEIQKEIVTQETLEANLMIGLSEGLLNKQASIIFSNQINEILEKKEKNLEELRSIELQIKEIISSRNQMLSNEVKEMIGKIMASDATYELRATVQSMLMRLVKKIIIKSHKINFYPWEYSESSLEIKKFRMLHPSYKKNKVEELCMLKSFQSFASDFEREIKLYFKNGESRIIYMGYDASFVNKKLFGGRPKQE